MIRKRLAVFLICCLGLVCTSFVLADAPTLQGLDPNKPITIPFSVQAAYNDTTMFFNIEWSGDRGDTHDLVRFTEGGWRKEGGPRREGQSTLDNDPARGPTNLNSVNYESRVTWMLNDPAGENAVPNFSSVGCFATCHDNSRAMPEWDPSQNLTKYLNKNPLNPDGDGQLDLLHHRQSRANPIGMSDDQKVIATDGTVGGRKGDGGNGAPYETNKLVQHDGELASHPKWVLDPATSEGGRYAFPFQDVHTDPNHDFMRAGDTPPISVAEAMDYDLAITDRGDGFAPYVPGENDTVPRRRLRDLRGTTRGDITAAGTTFTPDPNDPTEHFGTIESNTQRLLDTLDPDDTALADGGLYDVAFGLHTGMVTVRDHYVSFPLKLSLGAGAGDVEAEKLPGDAEPNWSLIDETKLELFLPGIASLEFLLGENTGKEYLDPATGELVDQVHGGAGGLMSGMSCQDCHSTSGSSPSGSMADLVPQRGGVWTPSPLLVPEPATIITLLVWSVMGGLALVVRGRRQRR